MDRVKICNNRGNNHNDIFGYIETDRITGRGSVNSASENEPYRL